MNPEVAPLPQQAFSAIILAGGHCSRLGRNKSLLQSDAQPLIARSVHSLASLCDDLIVVTNHPDRYASLSLPVRLVPDERPGVGSLMGIYSGLRVARHPWAVTVACDMPFLNLDLLRYLLPLARGHDVVIPRVGGWLEPLHAIYGRACLPEMARLLQEGQRQIIAFFSQVRVRYVEEQEVDRFDPEHLSFINVNTADDWEQTLALLQKRTDAAAAVPPRKT